MLKNIFNLIASTLLLTGQKNPEHVEHSYSIPTPEGAVAIWDSKPLAEKNYPTVLFIHGHLTNKEFFKHQVDSPLLENYRLIALDLPGYGKSEKPKNPEAVYSFPGFAQSVADVVDQLNLQNFVIVGWSLGGHVGLEATSLLSRLKGLLISGTPPIEISAAGFGQGFKAADPKILECFGKGNLSKAEAELLATVSGYDYSNEKRFIVDAILNTDEGAKTIYPKSILLGIGQDELGIVNSWPHPIAIAGGELDPAVNYNYVKNEVKFKNLWNNEVYLIPKAGHAAHMDRPEEFNLLLKQFLQTIFPEIE